MPRPVARLPACALAEQSQRELFEVLKIHGGQFAFGRAPISLLQRICPPPPLKAGPGNFSKSDFVGQCLSRHGYTQLTSYQPASRFWSFQLIEGSWLLALSLLYFYFTWAEFLTYWYGRTPEEVWLLGLLMFGSYAGLFYPAFALS